jgi:3-hydroxyacyl-CoA dehydrogenase
MTTGEHVPAPQALEWQVVDKIVPAGTDMVNAAKEFCKTKIGQPTPKIVEMPPPAPNADFGAWEASMAKARPGEIAPQAIIRCVQGAVAGPTFKDGDKVEKSEFGVLVSSPESSALRHMFFAERAGAKVDGLKVKPTPIYKVGIVGAGLMGGGIGMSCAEAGLEVVLLDINEEGTVPKRVTNTTVFFCRLLSYI